MENKFEGDYEQIKRQSMSKFSPEKAMMIALTYSCQFLCEHCGVAYYQKKGLKELSTDELKHNILDRLKDCGIDVAYFFGGEPTLHPDCVELIRYATSIGLYTRFDTNGYKLADMSFVKKLKEAGITYILVSIDSADPEKHDKFRKVNGAWANAVQAIKNCVDQGIQVGLSTVVNSQNLKDGDFKRIIQLGKDLGVFKIRTLTPIMCGRWIKDGIELSAQEKETFFSLLEPDFVMWEDFCDGTMPFVCCSIVKWFAFISAYGEVQPCCYIPVKFGNVREENLKDILSRMWKSALFNVEKDTVMEQDCPMNLEAFRNKIVTLADKQGGFPVSYEEDIFE